MITHSSLLRFPPQLLLGNTPFSLLLSSPTLKHTSTRERYTNGSSSSSKPSKSATLSPVSEALYEALVKHVTRDQVAKYLTAVTGGAINPPPRAHPIVQSSSASSTPSTTSSQPPPPPPPTVNTTRTTTTANTSQSSCLSATGLPVTAYPPIPSETTAAVMVALQSLPTSAKLLLNASKNRNKSFDDMDYDVNDQQENDDRDHEEGQYQGSDTQGHEQNADKDGDSKTRRDSLAHVQDVRDIVIFCLINIPSDTLTL